MRVLAIILSLNVVLGAAAEMRTLPREAFLDKLKGAWAGQMYGVCFGAPWEFRSNGAMITKDLGEWKPEQIAGAIGQDDCYVEMTFLKAIEDFGLDVTFEEAGKAFGASQYPLWHANRYGRNNIRRGILPPLSGNPKYNAHADDIDFQIEADLFGIIAPGLPQESNKLCDIFGHVMNYGDGVYGGMFVSGMYAAAYFEEQDVDEGHQARASPVSPPRQLTTSAITDVIAVARTSTQTTGRPRGSSSKPSGRTMSTACRAIQLQHQRKAQRGLHRDGPALWRRRSCSKPSEVRHSLRARRRLQSLPTRQACSAA
jgi:hypothetical protein